MGNISRLSDDVSAVNYHGLQTQLQHRFTRGLTFGASYQFSKALGIPTGGNGWDPYHTGFPLALPTGGSVTFPSQRQWFYGPTADDRRHYGSVNFAYAVPKLRTGNGLAGGIASLIVNYWTLSGITTLSSGAPINPACSISGASSPAVSDPTYSGAQGNGNVYTITTSSELVAEDMQAT